MVSKPATMHTSNSIISIVIKTTFLYSSKRQLNLLIFFSHTHIFSSYSHGHSFEEEHNVHDEPYGYELGDDPFEPQG